MSHKELLHHEGLLGNEIIIEGRFRVNTYDAAGEITGRKTEILTSHPFPPETFSIPQDELFSSRLAALTAAKGVHLPDDLATIYEFVQDTISNRPSEKAKPQCHLEQDVFSFFFGDPAVYTDFINGAKPPDHADQCCEITHDEKTQHWHGPWDGDNKRALVTLGLLGYAPAIQTIQILSKETSAKPYEELDGRSLHEFSGNDVVLAVADIIMARDAKKKQTEDEIAALAEKGKTSFESWGNRYEQVANSIVALAKVEKGDRTPELHARVTVIRNNLDYKNYQPEQDVSESPYAAFNRTQSADFTNKLKELRASDEIEGSNIVSTLMLLHTDGATRSISELLADEAITVDDLIHLSSDEIALIFSHEIEILTRDSEDRTEDDEKVLQLAEALHKNGWYFINHGENAGEHTDGYHGVFAFKTDENGNQIAAFDTCGSCTAHNDASIANAMDKIQQEVQQIVAAEPTEAPLNAQVFETPLETPVQMMLPALPPFDLFRPIDAAPVPQLIVIDEQNVIPSEPQQRLGPSFMEKSVNSKAPDPPRTQGVNNPPKLEPKYIKPTQPRAINIPKQKQERKPRVVSPQTELRNESTYEIVVPKKKATRTFIQKVVISPIEQEIVPSLPENAIITQSYQRADVIRQHRTPRKRKVAVRNSSRDQIGRKPPIDGVIISSQAEADVVIDMPQREIPIQTFAKVVGHQLSTKATHNIGKIQRNKPVETPQKLDVLPTPEPVIQETVLTDGRVENTVEAAADAVVQTPQISRRRRANYNRPAHNEFSVDQSSHESSSSNTDAPSSPKQIDAREGASKQVPKTNNIEQDAQAHAEEIVSQIFEKREEHHQSAHTQRQKLDIEATVTKSIKKESKIQQRSGQKVQQNEEDQTVQLATDTQGQPIYGRQRSSKRRTQGVSQIRHTEHVSEEQEVEIVEEAQRRVSAEKLEATQEHGTIERRNRASHTAHAVVKTPSESKVQETHRATRKSQSGTRQASAAVTARTGLHDPRDVRALARKAGVRLRTTLRDWMGEVPALDENALRQAFKLHTGKTVKIAKIRTGRGRNRTERWFMGDPSSIKAHKSSLRKGIPQEEIIELKLAA